MAEPDYVGKAGQLATMGEFLLRGYNVAMPEVDRGDDIFVVEDDTGRLWRIQVKTAVGKPHEYGYSGLFKISLEQLEAPRKPDLYYFLTLRAGDRWEFVIMPRATLRRFHVRTGMGSVAGEHLILNCRFTATEVLCSSANLQRYRHNWRPWPIIGA
jgi:hypothetical protein